MNKYEPLVWVVLSVLGLYVLRRQYRRGYNHYDPVVPEKERRRRDTRFAIFIAIYVLATVGSFFATR